MAQSGHPTVARQCPLSGVKRTSEMVMFGAVAPAAWRFSPSGDRDYLISSIDRLASRRQPTPQTFLGLRRASSGFGAPFLFFVTVQPFGQAAGDVAWFSVRLYVSPHVVSQ
jgi:hypothetical protein